MSFNFPLTYYNLTGKSRNFFYKNFIEKKIGKPCFQSILCKEFEIYDEKSWKNIQEYKIKVIKDKYVAEFSYKLLNNILCNSVYVSKWKKDTSNRCAHCKQIEI